MADSIQILKKHIPSIFRWITLILIFLIILNRAWMSDDAYITLRTVDNFINGYGLTWNVNERVEVYTHPLWMLLLSLFYFFTHEAYLTTIFVSLGLVLFTLIYLQSKIKPLHHFILVFLVLGFSNAFVDFATSGLENVLNYALFTLFFFQFFDKKGPKDNYFRIVFLAGLIGMTRLDLLLMILPLLIYVFFQQSNKWQAIKVGLLGVSPLIVWEIFSYIYYGFMFPNTAYAKLNNGVPGNELLLQGVLYLLATIKRDPLTLLVILLAIIFGFSTKNIVLRLWSLGIIFYLAYVMKIGGDFMIGRFLTVPFLVSVLLLFQSFIRKQNIPKTIMTGILVITLGMISPIPTFRQFHPDGFFEGFHGIADERDVYFRGTGLLRYNDFNGEPYIVWVDQGKDLKNLSKTFGKQVFAFEYVGFLGYYAGKDVYIIDTLGIGNAYLAHQPMEDISNWRIGHYKREVTEDYIQSLDQGRNVIQDEELAILFEDVIIRSQLDVWEKDRLVYIISNIK
jgi:arabinofuranosyltransferase